MYQQNDKAYFEYSLSDEVYLKNALTLHQANDIFNFFQHHWLFKWADAHNDCEDRANAICILLDQWRIPNYKGWVFSGYFLKGEQGALINLWNYHVAAAIPVSIDNITHLYIIDPATLTQTETIEFWANNVTEFPYSYYLMKYGNYYIFPTESIQRDNWHWRDQENHRWTIEGLAGINGVAPDGEYYVNANRKIIEQTRIEFNKLKNGGTPFK
jgi:hypothetical protein